MYDIIIFIRINNDVGNWIPVPNTAPFLYYRPPRIRGINNVSIIISNQHSRYS